MTTRELVISAIASSANVSADKLTDSTDIAADLGLDSLDMVELMMQLEEQTGVTLENDELEKAKTVGQLVALIESKKSTR